jgi:hypothetical protein
MNRTACTPLYRRLMYEVPDQTGRLALTGAWVVVADGVPVDLLLNNAGVMAPPTRMTTVDGFTSVMAHAGRIRLTGREKP